MKVCPHKHICRCCVGVARGAKGKPGAQAQPTLHPSLTEAGGKNSEGEQREHLMLFTACKPQWPRTWVSLLLMFTYYNSWLTGPPEGVSQATWKRAQKMVNPNGELFILSSVQLLWRHTKQTNKHACMTRKDLQTLVWIRCKLPLCHETLADVKSAALTLSDPVYSIIFFIQRCVKIPDIVGATRKWLRSSAVELPSSVPLVYQLCNFRHEFWNKFRLLQSACLHRPSACLYAALTFRTLTLTIPFNTLVCPAIPTLCQTTTGYALRSLQGGKSACTATTNRTRAALICIALIHAHKR